MYDFPFCNVVLGWSGMGWGGVVLLWEHPAVKRGKKILYLYWLQIVFCLEILAVTEFTVNSVNSRFIDPEKFANTKKYSSMKALIMVFVLEKMRIKIWMKYGLEK